MTAHSGIRRQTCASYRSRWPWCCCGQNQDARNIMLFILCCGAKQSFNYHTAQVKGWRAYTAAVANLFDPAESRADLISIRPVDDQTIEMRWRLEGVLKLPGRPRIKPYTGATRCATLQRSMPAQLCSDECTQVPLVAGTISVAIVWFSHMSRPGTLVHLMRLHPAFSRGSERRQRRQ